MPYKKYIYRNGKKYGPYIYHSRRVNGKVVSEYHGQKKSFGFNPSKLNYKGFFLAITSVLFVFALLYVAFSFNSSLTGRAALGLEANYVEGEPLSGVLSLSLRDGELLPAGSKIVLQTTNQIEEYLLSDILEGEATFDGDFYVEGKFVSGIGPGYGVEGTKTIHPEVNFVLNVLSETSSGEETSTEIGETSGGSSVGTSGSEETPTDEITQEQTPEETISGGETTAEVTGETSGTEETAESAIAEQASSIEVTSEEGGTSLTGATTETEEAEIEVVEETASESVEESALEPEEETPSEEAAPITGNFITTFFGFLASALQGGFTGQATLNVEDQISGTVSVNSPYTYTLKEGQTVELASSDEDVNVIIEGNEVTVTTDYGVEEKGFGEEYLGDYNTVITINLADLNFVSQPGDLDVKLVYKDIEILSLETVLAEGAVRASVAPEVLNGTVEIITNETLTNVTNVTTPKVVSQIVLTETEKELLLAEFGNASVKTTKAELVNGRVVVRYELGKYWVEYSYVSGKDLTLLMERDRVKWLKDLAKALSKGKSENEQLDKYVGEFSISGEKTGAEQVVEETPVPELNTEVVNETEKNVTESVNETVSNVSA